MRTCPCRKNTRPRRCSGAVQDLNACGVALLRERDAAAALGKPLATIAVGQDAMDIWCEAMSGRMPMGPTARLLNAFDKRLELMVKANPYTLNWARDDTREVIDAIHEAGTLIELLKGRLLGMAAGGFKLIDAATRNFDTIVSHSKGNRARSGGWCLFSPSIFEAGCDGVA